MDSTDIKSKILGILLILVMFFFIGTSVFLGIQRVRNEREKPANSPVLSLPFSEDDLPDKLAPMGETLFHPDETGHKGIDFRWYYNETPDIVAVMDAEITAITDSQLTDGAHNIMTENGIWGVTYTDIFTVNPALKVGDFIKKGDYLGTPTRLNFPPDVTFLTMHLQFGYAERRGERVQDSLCPMSYFDEKSRNMIEEIWYSTDWDVLKANAKDICTGYYKNRVK